VIITTKDYQADYRFAHLMMQKQLGNSVKGKEAEVAKERRPGNQPRKSVLKGNRQNNSKGATQFH